jgi:chromosome segregation ATPase
MATVAEQVVEITARLANVDADLTRRDEAQAALEARVAELEAQLAGIDPALAELLEPVKAAVAALDDRTPEPEAPVV